MVQYTTTTNYFKSGKTLLNRNFSLSEIVRLITKAIQPYMSNFDYVELIKNANTKDAFPQLDTYLKDKAISDTLINTRIGKYGTIRAIKGGMSKRAIVAESDKGQMFVIKYNRFHNNVDISAFNSLLERYTKFQPGTFGRNQTLSQALAYEIFKSKPIGKYLLAPYRYYQRYNVLIEPYIDTIGSFNACCNFLKMEEAEISEISVTMMKSGIVTDILAGNQGNCGVLNGKLVFLDYGYL